MHFTSSFLERTREVMCEFGKDALELHDIVAVWCALSNPPQSALASQSDSHPVSASGGQPQLQDGWEVTRRKFEIER